MIEPVLLLLLLVVVIVVVVVVVPPSAPEGTAHGAPEGAGEVLRRSPPPPLPPASGRREQPLAERQRRVPVIGVHCLPRGLSQSHGGPFRGILAPSSPLPLLPPPPPPPLHHHLLPGEAEEEGLGQPLRPGRGGEARTSPAKDYGDAGTVPGPVGPVLRGWDAGNQEWEGGRGRGQRPDAAGLGGEEEEEVEGEGVMPPPCRRRPSWAHGHGWADIVLDWWYQYFYYYVASISRMYVVWILFSGDNLVGCDVLI